MPQKLNEYRKCRHCSKQFKITRNWQVFCSDNCRKNWNYLEAGYCFYCGDPGVNRDHIHPVAARSGERSFEGQETVYACTECNSNLGSKVFDGIESRIQFLIDRYKDKYELNKQLPTWNETELESLGPTLRTHIKSLLSQRHKAERRVVYLQTMLGIMDRDRKVKYSGSMSDL